MTDNEIIKALECMASVNENGLCYAEQENIARIKEGKPCVVCGNIENETYECCPFYQVPLDTCMDDGCQQKALQLAIDLINRQKAEIERLEKECEEAWEAHSTQIEEYDKLFEEAQTLIKRSRAEAIKEFAENLKGMSTATWWFDEDEPTKVHVDHYVTESDIDNLAKEMVGERE